MIGKHVLLTARAAVTGLAALVATMTASGEQLSSGQRSVAVHYKGGEVEHYVIAWSADTNLSVREEGAPSTLFHPIDDRRCFWNIGGTITRQVYLVSHTGAHYSAPNLSRVYDKGQANEGSSWLVGAFRSENCNDAAPRRNSDYGNMKRQVLGDFGTTVDRDFAAVKEELKSSAGVINVNDDASS